MKSSFFTFTSKDAIQAAINAVIAAVVIGLYSLVTKEGFNLFNTDWVSLGQSVINWAFAAFVGSLGKDLLTTKKGNVLGMIPVEKKKS